MKRYLKYLIYKFHLAGWLDKALYHASGLRNKKANTAYRLTHRDLNFPPDYFLYETFRLDYRKFIEDGELTAKELLEWMHPYLPVKDPAILDWGCGAARIIRHLPALVPGAALYGCDINEEMITWNKTHHGEIAFTTVNNFAPLPYAPAFFDLVYGLSVLTHIAAENQQDWIMELHRVIKNQALLLVTTQGRHYEHKLIPAEKKVLAAKGIYTKSFMKSGHRMMSTYHGMAAFKNLIAPYFDVLELHEGHQHPARMGGQDVWILRKKEA